MEIYWLHPGILFRGSYGQEEAVETTKGNMFAEYGKTLHEMAKGQ